MWVLHAYVLHMFPISGAVLHFLEGHLCDLGMGSLPSSVNYCAVPEGGEGSHISTMRG